MINENSLRCLITKGEKQMIIKRIICKVKESEREMFYEHQKQWKPLSKVKGFIGQIGGWNNQQQLTACIYSFWESEIEYQEFMEKEHDQIFVHSGQESTYESINVSLFEEKLSIPGLEDNIVAVIRKSNYIRIALSQVKQHKLKHFVEIQEKVWNAEMQKTEGMLGGTFSTHQKQNNEFLVLTGWESADCHQNYMKDNFPELFKKAKPKDDVLELTGEQFKVEEAWRVCPIF